LSVRNAPVYAVRQAVTVTPSGMYVDLQPHFRVERGNVFIPEVILRYRFPGQRAVATDPPFSLDNVEIKDGRITSLNKALDELEQDRPRVSERLGDLVPGAISSHQPVAGPRNWRRTRLLLDPETPLSLFETLLHSLHVEGYHPFDLVVWDPAAQRPGAVSFDTTDGP